MQTWLDKRPAAPRFGRVAQRSDSPGQSGFTLVELLTVISIMIVLIGLAAPAVNSLKRSSDITEACYDVAGVLETAATYARANNTYAWVGFYEEGFDTPAKAGVGRLVLSVVYSNDGTQIIDPSLAGPNPIPQDRLTQLGKLIKIDNMHLADIPAPGSPRAKGGSVNWDERPSVVNDSVTYRIGATTPKAASVTFQYPVGGSTGTAQYKFEKIIQFSPQGETIMLMDKNAGASPWLEVGLQPTHGNAVDTKTTNVAAVQVAGINPQVRIYRR